MRDYLCGACKAHDEAVRELLAGRGLDWVEAPRLVRGLDYYVRTTFEWQAEGLDAAQNALGAAAATTGCRRPSAARPPRASAGPWAWTGPCSPSSRPAGSRPTRGGWTPWSCRWSRRPWSRPRSWSATCAGPAWWPTSPMPNAPSTAT
jgi:hypothetical protein